MKTKLPALGIALLLVPGLGAQSGTAPLLFDPNADPLVLVADACTGAVEAKKLVMIEFGADWCHDCQALARHMTDARVKAVMDTRFVLVRVDVGHFDKNLELAKSYGLDVKKGIPTIAVIDPASGRIVYATLKQEWSDARNMTPTDILETLKEIRP